MNDRTHRSDVAGPDGQPQEQQGGALAGAESLDAEQRGSLLGFVAHEMRNPLSTALWSAELLARLSPEDRAGARGEKLSGMCLRSLQRLRLLVEDHFLSERLEVGGMPVRLEAVPLHEAIEAVRQRPGVGTVQGEVGEELAAWVDRALLERALEALLAAATRGGVEAIVSARASGNLVTLRFSGAPAAEDALQAPRKGTASDPTGRALALYMARHVADAVGGSIAIVGGDYLLALPLPPAGAGTDQG